MSILRLDRTVGGSRTVERLGADVMRRSAAVRRDPLSASLGHMRNADALARLRPRPGALRAHGLAEKHFERRAGEPHSDWIRFHNRAEFCLHRTLAALPGELVRDRALYTAHLALAQARQGEVELACATGARANALLPSGSVRTSNTLARTREVPAASGTKAHGVVEWIEVSRRWS